MLGLLGLKKKKKSSAEAAKSARVPDKLTNDSLASGAEVLLGVSGVPKATDSLAYEPLQKLMAVGTLDGRVKLLGQMGVERTLMSASKRPYGTRQLMFLPNRGVLLRVSEGGCIESWSLAVGRLGISVRALPSVKLEGDSVTYVALMSRDPFLVIGCSSGAVRFASILPPEGNAADAMEVKAIKLMPYAVQFSDLECEGEVVELSALSIGAVHRLTVVHKTSGLVIWDLRSASLVARLDPRVTSDPVSLEDYGDLRTACWTQCGDFATGHQSGDVLVWKLPPLGTTGCCSPTLQATLRLVQGPTEPVVNVRYLPGIRPWLLVLGGQQEDYPDGLTMMPYPTGGEGVKDAAEFAGEDEFEGEPSTSVPSSIKLPWLGNMLDFAVASGSVLGLEDPTTILGVLDIGQLLAYDLPTPPPPQLPPSSANNLSNSDSSQHSAIGGNEEGTAVASEPTSNAAEESHVRTRVDATTFGLPFQNPGLVVTCTDTFVIPSSSAKSGSISAELLRDMCAGISVSSPSDLACTALLGAGLPPCAPSDAAAATIYVTGYTDGSVRMWDVYGEQPQLVTSAPLTTVSELQGKKLSSVSAVDVSWEHGLLVTGHSEGEVFVYQFCSRPRQLEVASFSSVGMHPSGSDRVHEAPGFQLKLRTSVSTADVLCVSYSPLARLVVAGDKAGGILCIDVASPSVRWYCILSPAPVAAVQVASCLLPAKKDRNAGLDVDPEINEGWLLPSVFFAASDASAGVLSAKNGAFIGRNGCVRPKNASQLLSMELLDGGGMPLWMQRCRFHQVHLAAGGHSAASSRQPSSDLDGARSSCSTQDTCDGLQAAATSSSSDPPMAAFVLLCTSTHVRTYRSSNVIQANRETEAKRESPEALTFAGTFHVNGAAGIVVTAQSDLGTSIQVLSLPSLDLVHQMSVAQCISWFWAPPSGGPARLSKLWTLSKLGQLLMIGDGNELMHLGIAAGLPELLPPSSFYDWEMASAAHAASLALELSTQDPGHCSLDADRERELSGVPSDEGGSRMPSGSHVILNEGRRTSECPDLALTEGRHEAKGGFFNIDKGLMGGALSKVQAGLLGGVSKGVSMAVEGATRGMTTVVGGLKDVVIHPHAAEDPVAVYDRHHPDLKSLLSTAYQTSSDAVSEERAPVSAGGERAPGGVGGRRASGGGGGGGGGADHFYPVSTPARLTTSKGDHYPAFTSTRLVTSTGDENSSDRSQLFANVPKLSITRGPESKPSPAAPGHVRTASEIKRHYQGAGSGSVRSHQVRDVMEDNKRMLGDRGDKLRQLDAKTAEMEGDAMNFASMAKQLREQQEKRAGKWW